MTSIEFDGAQATGITSLTAGTRRRDRAERGVVLCAGAFGTPHILMLSGTGPAEHLRAHDIPLRRDAPEVGANLQDHSLLPVLHASARPITLKDAKSPLNLVRWLLFGRGMLSSNLAEAMAFTSSDGGSAPDLEICFVPAEGRGQGLEPPSTHAWAAGVVLLTPITRLDAAHERRSDASARDRLRPALRRRGRGCETALPRRAAGAAHRPHRAARPRVGRRACSPTRAAERRGAARVLQRGAADDLPRGRHVPDGILPRCACKASKVSGSRMRRSCPPCRAGTRTRRLRSSPTARRA